MTVAKVIVVDEARCLACKQCVIECALAHSEATSLAEALSAGVPLQARIRLEPTETGAVPVQCRQCAEAPCMVACPVDAMSREGDGPVLIDAELCVGCRLCVKACPYDSVWMASVGRLAVKCDLCIGLPGPACVAGCPTGALRLCIKNKPE